LSVSENWNVLQLGCPNSADDELTSAMVDALRHRIVKAGGLLAVWAILSEDCYETTFGDGFYLHIKGIALNEDDATRLAELGRVEEDRITNANRTTGYKLHVRKYTLGLDNNAPMLMESRNPEEEFTIGDFVQILSEIEPGGGASKLHIGWNTRKAGPFISLQ
jgi:hypothetical protein